MCLHRAIFSVCRPRWVGGWVSYSLSLFFMGWEGRGGEGGWNEVGGWVGRVGGWKEDVPVWVFLPVSPARLVHPSWSGAWVGGWVGSTVV